MKIEQICRVCLEQGEMKPLFTTNCLSHIQMSCAEAILKISTISAAENDGLPEHICKKCLSKLKSAYKFKILCEDSHAKLVNRQFSCESSAERNNYDNVEDVSTVITDLKEEENVFQNDAVSTALEVKYEPDIDDASEFPDLQNSSCDDEMDHSNKTENSLQPIINSQENVLVDNGTEDVAIVEMPAPKVKRKKLKKKKKKLRCRSDAASAVMDGGSITPEKTFHCEPCDKFFLSKYTLKKHAEAHIAGEPYFCDICQKSFRSEYAHKTKHSERDSQLKCEICGKVFLRTATLRTHLLGHQDQLPFRCTHAGCGKAFPINSRLQLHLKVHTDERNFICQYCSHAARDKQQLTVHIRYFHTKEKNFLCGDCGKTFVSPQARYYHLKRHENIRNHHCPHCDKSFVFAFGLQEHLVTHTGEKRFPCSLCDARFSRKAHKEKHESSLHGINRPAVKRLPAPLSTTTPPAQTV